MRLYTCASLRFRDTAHHPTIGPRINESQARLLLIRTAHGDSESLAALYDSFASDTYSVCAHYIAEQPQLDDTMMALWQRIWTDARALATRTGSVRDILVITAHAEAGAAAEIVVAA